MFFHMKVNSLLDLLHVILIISGQIRQLFSLFVLQENQANLTDGILIEKLFDKQLHHFDGVEESRWLQIRH